MKATRKLQEQGQQCKCEMHAVWDLAKSTHKSSDPKAKQGHKHDAMAYESQMKDLDKRAVNVIFRDKVRGYPLQY
jgi:hypothetical protein